MLRTALRTGSALFTLLAMSGLVLGQTQPRTAPREVQPQVAPRDVQTQTAPRDVTPGGNAGNALHAKSIIGASVSIQGGTNVGTVQDLVLNDEGVIDFIIVSEGGKLITVPWEAAKFNFERRTAVINITQDQFRQIPTYTTERYPDFYAPAYRTELYRYYGVTPGRERRIERRDNRRP